MNYRVVYGLRDGAVMTIEQYTEEIEKLNSIFDTEAVPCPQCGKREMYYVDSSEVEEYTSNGTFENTERYYCDNCGTFADVTQVYVKAGRRVVVQHDEFDD